MAHFVRSSFVSASRERISVARRLFSQLSSATGIPPNGPALQRSFMYVPADKEDKLKKMADPKPDAIYPDILVLNCEDGVALSNKTLARNNLENLLNESDKIAQMSHFTQVSVRVNSIESGFAKDDLKSVLSCKTLPDMICLPKVDSLEHLKWLSDTIKECHVTSHLLVMAMIESARSLIDLVEICRFACDPQSRLAFRLQGLIFGSDDYCHSMGVSRTTSNAEVLYPRQHLVTVAKAFSLSAIDMVNINIKDLSPLESDCAEGACLGFSGKQVIHPAQLPVVHSAFRPSTERVQWARSLLKEVERVGGSGTLVFRGQMIDEPTILQARQLDAMALAVEEKEKRYDSH